MACQYSEFGEQHITMNEQADAGSDATTDRRHHIRVQDAIALQFRKLTDMPAAGQEQSRPQTKVGPVRRRAKYEIEGYATVKRDFPAVAGYIDALEERIRELLLGGDVPLEKPTHLVSLSAGGISFSDRVLLRPGEMIGLSLTLFPSGRRIGADARILSGNDAPEVARSDAPSYRAVFVRISDADRLAIEQHVTRLLDRRTTLQE